MKWFACVAIALFLSSSGISIDDALQTPPKETPPNQEIKVKTELMEVREVAAGTPLGYGGAFVTARPSRIGLLPLGYDDGLRRSLSGRVVVLVNGEEAPIVAAVSMDLTFVDVTGLPARRGDRVVCIGADGSRRVSAWDWARAASTIPYEILCGIGPRVPRVTIG